MDENQGKQAIILSNRHDAFKYLKKRGYKISVGKFYTHCKQGHVQIEPDGTITSDSLNRYVRQQGLQRLGLDDPANESLGQLQEEKLRKEVERLKIDGEMKQFQFEREQGKYIPRELLDLELASRAGVFDSGLKQKIKERGPDLVYAAGGQPGNVQDLVAMLIEMIDECLNEFSRMDRFQVIFESDSEVDHG